jgi:hypothetical protein
MHDMGSCSVEKGMHSMNLPAVDVLKTLRFCSGKILIVHALLNKNADVFILYMTESFYVN